MYGMGITFKTQIEHVDFDVRSVTSVDRQTPECLSFISAFHPDPSSTDCIILMDLQARASGTLAGIFVNDDSALMAAELRNHHLEQ